MDDMITPLVADAAEDFIDATMDKFYPLVGRTERGFEPWEADSLRFIEVQLASGITPMAFVNPAHN